jgi:hypothetical protein
LQRKLEQWVNSYEKAGNRAQGKVKTELYKVP